MQSGRYPLYLDGQSTYRFQIPEDTKRQETFNYRVKLPGSQLTVLGVPNV